LSDDLELIAQSIVGTDAFQVVDKGFGLLGKDCVAGLDSDMRLNVIL